MNYLTNQSGERVPAVGQAGSAMRLTDEFNITMPKLVAALEQMTSIVSCKSEFISLEAISILRSILRNENIPNDEDLYSKLIRAAVLNFHYSNFVSSI
jgi:hypothetical protein